jgi:uncharacterized RDD family membrane protein YckC
VVDRKDVGSWLQGPGSRAPEAAEYAGQRLGLPREGAGSIGRVGRRLLGVLVDWTLCTFIAFGVFHVPLPFTATAGSGAWITLVIFGVENLLLVGTLGYTIGHRVVGLRVRSINGRPPSPVQTVVRTVLLCLFLPAMFWDRDGRGLHDKAAGTVIVRL